MLLLSINGKKIKGLLDTGADRSIIAHKDWPASWPLNVAEQTLQGLGFVHSPSISAQSLPWQDEEGHGGSFQPYVLNLPVTLWGRDILVQMDITLHTGCSEVSQNMMKRMGYTPGKGLGIKLQGNTSPVSTTIKQDRKGLGFS